MKYNTRDIVYNINGKNYNIGEIPGSTYPNNKGTGYLGVYRFKGTTKYKSFSGNTEAEVDIKRINYHLEYTGTGTVNNFETVGSNALVKSAVPDVEKPITPIIETAPQVNYLTVSEACDKWLRSVIHDIRPATFQSYEETCRNYIKHYLGQIDIAQLSVDDVCGMISQMKEKGLAYATINNANGRLSQAIDFLSEPPNSLLVYNVAKSKVVRGKLLKIRRAKKMADKQLKNDGTLMGEEEGKAFSHEEMKKFIRCAYERKDRLCPAYVLQSTYGLRPGEALGVKVENVYLDKKIILLEQDIARLGVYDPITLKKIGTKLQEDDVKSIDSKRAIFISDEMVELLKRHKRLIEQEKIKYANKYKDQGFMFPTKYGTPTEPRNYARSFAKVTKQTNIVGHTPHNLRATYSTRLDEKDVKKDAISIVLGHKVDKTVTDIYIDKSNKKLKEELTKVTSEMKELHNIALSIKVDEYSGNY